MMLNAYVCDDAASGVEQAAERDLVLVERTVVGPFEP